ncbi:MAG: PQQ-binding-like beta-propeller repeat protein [Phycisphaerae bacterium]
MRPYLCALAGLLLLAAGARAQTAIGPSPATVPATDRIADLIRNLGSDEYKVRTSAQEQLLEAGPSARALLEKAAAGDDAEVRQRAAEILSQIAATEKESSAQAIRKNVLWTFPVNGGAAGPPVVAGGKVVFLGADRKLYAVDAANGKEAWGLGTFTIKVGECDQPVISDGLVVITDRVDCLYAADLAKGELLWRCDSWVGLGLPCLAGGAIWIGDGAAGLRMLDARTGKEKWKIDSRNFGTRPAVHGGADGMLFVVDALDKAEGESDAPSDKRPAVSCLAAATGKRIWQYDPQSLCTCLIARDDVVYLKAGAIVAALDVKTGRKLWQFDLPAIIGEEGFMVLADAAVYVTCYNKLFCLDARSGQKNWSVEFDSLAPPEKNREAPREMMGLAADGRAVYVGRPDGLRALDFKTGKEAWFLRTANRLHVGPAVADGVVYFGTTRAENPAPPGGQPWPFDDPPGMHALKVSKQ